MQWQLFIASKLDIFSRSPKIISDLTGILVTDAFLDFIKSQDFQFIIVDTLPELLQTSNKLTIPLIITRIKAIPPFINKEFKRKIFNFSDIPLNGKAFIEFSKLPSEHLISLLDYVYDTDRHTVIHTTDLSAMVDKALNYKRYQKLNILKEQLLSKLEEPKTYESILNLGTIWGEILFHSYVLDDKSYLSLIPQVDAYSDDFFLSNQMQSVFYASRPHSPKTVDKILHNIKVDNKDKMALLCFDCMGYAEWFVLKDFLNSLNFDYEERPVFAFLPSVTSISRQAVFSGSLDVYNIKSPNRNNEIANFSLFFNYKETKSFSEKDEISDNSLIGYHYINILYNFFDELGHSVIFPQDENTKALYFEAVKAYLSKSKLAETLTTLFNNDFKIYFCSDHGSVLATGNGQKLEKYYVDSVAKRAVIIPAQADELIENKKIKIPFVDNKLIVLPEGRTMFTYANKKEINHGGISIEEMVVPYIKII